jgi:hypothetical protein
VRPETITAGVEELKATYGGSVRVAIDGSRTLIRIENFDFPTGCHLPGTDLLLVLDPGQPKPQHYVRLGQTLANGNPPKNPSNTTVAGESWMSFSFNFPYTEGDSLCRFVAMIRQRFAKNE